MNSIVKLFYLKIYLKIKLPPTKYTNFNTFIATITFHILGVKRIIFLKHLKVDSNSKDNQILFEWIKLKQFTDFN